jgi:hypothetical protein
MEKFYINDFEVIQDTAPSTIKLELFQFLSSSTDRYLCNPDIAGSMRPL